MKQPLQGSVSQTAHDAEFADLVEAVIDQIHAGQPVDLTAMLAEHPDMAPRLRRLLPTLQAMAEVGQLEGSATDVRSSPPALEGPQQGILGDYQILQEIGRGGMGVVYEAQQISLRRRVALKILPFAAVMDPRQLARFKNEAQAAATLDHPNIVSVYAIGCDQGVHYFAMQYVAGQTLAEVIRDLRQRDGIPVESQQASATLRYLLSGKSDGRVNPVPAEQLLQPTSDSAPTVRPPQAALSTEHPTNAAAFFRTVAHLGVQASEAIDHAHQHGVLHRDIKPGNLMLDATGKLWVTDFGLARIEGDTGMTMTGDLLGTMRYMSPEQALAKRVVVDHRSDIYSLGVTLYEVLTLHPAFAGEHHQELLRQIAFDEAKPLRTWNKAIPPDLETIVLKSMAKDPRERYATAQDLADDLRRFLNDQSIIARRPTLARRLLRWSRRHRAVVTTASAVLGCALVVGAALLWRERSQTLSALEQVQQARDVAELERARADTNFREARQAVDDYLTNVSQSKLLDVPGAEPLRQELLQGAVAYYTKFAEEHKDDPALQAELAAAHSNLAFIYAQGSGGQSPASNWNDEIRQVVDIVEPLVEQGTDVSQWKSLREGILFRYYRGGVPRAGDPFALDMVRICDRGIAAWEKLSRANPDVDGFASDLAGFHLIRATYLDVLKDPTSKSSRRSSLEQAVAIWERLPQNTLGSTHQLMLGMALRFLANVHNDQNKQAEYQYAKKAIEVLTAPDRPAHLQAAFDSELIGAYLVLAWGAGGIGHQEEAMDAFRKMTEFEPQDAHGYSRRSRAFDSLNEPDRALADLSRAIELEPDNVVQLRLRSQMFEKSGQIEKALADLSRAIELEPKNAGRFNERANFYHRQGRDEKALADYTRTVELEPRHPFWYWQRAHFYHQQVRYQEAMADCNKGLELEPNNADWFGLHAVIFEQLNEPDKALADLNRAVELQPKNAGRFNERANFYYRQGRKENALADYTRTVELEPRHPFWYWQRAHFYHQQVRYQEAMADCNKGLELEPNNADWFGLHAVIFEQLNEPDKALADLDRAVELQPKNAGRFNERANFYHRQGRKENALADVKTAIDLDPSAWQHYILHCSILVDMRRYDDALDGINQGLDHAPDYSRLWEARSWVYARLEKYNEALADMNAAVARAKSDIAKYELPLARGRLQRRMGRLAEAEADFKLACERAANRDTRATAKAELGLFEEALTDAPETSEQRLKILIHMKKCERALDEVVQAEKESPKRGVMHSLHGMVLAELGRYDEAAAEFSRAIELAPHRVEDYYRRGWIASVQGRYGDAHKDLEEALLIDQYNPLSMRRLAWFLATCPDVEYGNPARAVSLAEKAASIRPHEGIFWYTLGICLYRNGNYDEALKACQSGIEMRDLPHSPIEEPRIATDRDGYAGFFLAMSQWQQLGDKGKARDTYDAAVAWMNEHAADDMQLARFQLEAADLLGVQAPSGDTREATATPQPSD